MCACSRVQDSHLIGASKDFATVTMTLVPNTWTEGHTHIWKCVKCDSRHAFINLWLRRKKLPAYFLWHNILNCWARACVFVLLLCCREARECYQTGRYFSVSNCSARLLCFSMRWFCKQDKNVSATTVQTTDWTESDNDKRSKFNFSPSPLDLLLSTSALFKTHTKC